MYLCPIMKALLELASFMLDPYARKKDRQKLVRNLKVHNIHVCTVMR